jgi:hypothetical protein
MREQQVGAACRLHRRRGDPLRFRREGRLELTTAPRSQTVAPGIPEGFHSLKPKRVAPGGAEASGSHLLIVLEDRLQAVLVCFGLSATVLVTHPVFVEHLGHFLGDHVAIVLNSHERDFFSSLGLGLRSGSFLTFDWTRGWSFWCVTHRKSIHQAGGEKGTIQMLPGRTSPGMFSGMRCRSGSRWIPERTW